jgi:glycosyltransferase involved in cell wall biosynthesis
VYESLRSAHLERAHQLAPASILGRTRRYDFDPSLAEGLDVHRVGTSGAVMTVLRSSLTAIEVNEPLMLSCVVRTAAVVAAARAVGMVRRERAVLVSYAIENRNPWEGPASRGLRARARAALRRIASRYVARQLDRVAYGTEAAASLYASVLGEDMTAVSRLVPALSAPCHCAPAATVPSGGVLFLGALTQRKGVDRLLEAWADVVAARPDASMVVVGAGPLESLVRERALSDPTVEMLLSPPRIEVHRLLRQASVLVLLSQPMPSWREQVGLPIVEALAHGCTVVTTDQTGLAAWLGAHGHHVLPAAASSRDVAGSIVEALVQGRSRSSVLADLPAADGRLEADAWLFAEGHGRPG